MANNKQFGSNIFPGSVDVTIQVLLRKTADNTEQTGKAHTDVTAYYWRQGGTPTQITMANGSSITAAHADGAWEEADSTNMPGIYRFDLPDAAVATGADWVVISAKVTGCYVFFERYSLNAVLPAADSGATGGVNDVAKINGVSTSSVTTINAHQGTTAANTAQTGDNFARLGAPAGASVSADIAAVKAETASIQSDTNDIQTRLPAALTAGGNMKSDALAINGVATTSVTTVSSHVGTTGASTAQTGDSFARLGAPAGASVSADVAAVKAETASIQSDTNDIQTRLPAALVSGRMDSSVGSYPGNTAQTGDSFARLGAPSGASVSADVAAVKAETASIQSDTNDIQTRLPAALVSGRMDSSVGSYPGNTAQTGDAFARIGANGAGLTAVPWNAAWDAEVQSEVDDALVAQRLDELLNADSDIDGAQPPAVGSVFHEALTKTAGSFTYDQATDSLEAIRDNMGSTPPTAAAIADAVWEEALADHSGTAGSTAAALNAAGSAGDPWSTALPGAYGAGTAGKIIGDNLNATVGSRATQASVDTIDDFLDTEVAAIKTKTDFLPSATAGAAGGLFIAGANAATTVNITGSLSGSVGSVATGGISSASFAAGAIDSTAIADSAIAAAKFAAGAVDAAALATDAVTEIWSAASRTLTDKAGFSLAADQSGVTIGTVNALGTTAKNDVRAEFRAGFGTSGSDVIAELGVATPAKNPSPAAALMLLYMALRNRFDSSSSLIQVRDDAGNVICKATCSDDNVTYVQQKLQSGP